jgi:hypothetical protein
MTKWKSHGVVTVLFLCAGTVQASAIEPYKEARFYYTACREAIRIAGGDKNGDRTSSITCISFLSGISDYNYLLRDAGMQGLFCEPAQNTNYDLMQTYVSFIDGSAESGILQSHAVSVFAAAMAQKYPCK